MLRLSHLSKEIAVRGPVLKAADYGVAVEAERLLAEAKAEAEAIRAEAKLHYETEKQRGYQEGLEQGKAEMSEQVVATLGQSALYFSKAEQALIDVVIKATRRVIGDFDERDRVERIVRRALEPLRQQSQVRLKVAPQQSEWLATRLEAILSQFPRIQFLDIQTDARLPGDGCVLETELGVIDATVETQLRAIEKALISALR